MGKEANFSAAPFVGLHLLGLFFLLSTASSYWSMNECTYDVNMRSANCSNRALTDIPHGIPHNTRFLLLADNNLTTIRNDSFSGLTLLVDISLKNNLISHIEPGAFYGLRQLHSVNLIGNHLVSIPKNLFGENVFLVDVFLRSNWFETVPNLDMVAHFNLSFIDLASNRISCGLFNIILPRNCRLTVIDMSENYIQSIKEGDFDELLACSEITLLDLGDNAITSVEPQSFLGLAVPGLNFAGNPLHEAGVQEVFNASFLNGNIIYISVARVNRPNHAFQLTADMFVSLQNSSVQKLSLSNNNITSFPANVFRHLTRISELISYNNDISYVSPSQFNGMTSLIKLSLVHCGIGNINAVGSSRWQPPLLTLNLANNKLEEIPSKVFSSLTSLKTLVLQYNYISCLHADSFYDLSNLELLMLNDNELDSALANQDIFGLTPNLLTLDLRNSKISQLDPENSFTSLNRLQSLNLQSNPIKLIDLWDAERHVSLFKGMLKLNSLDLSFTGVSGQIPPGCFKDLRNLQRLHLQGISATSLHRDVFQNLSNLELLSLEDNNLQELPSGVLRAQTVLRFLYLGRNPIDYLGNDLFRNTTRLALLSLSGTNIVVISQQTLSPILHSLATIDLTMMTLSCTCENKWLRTWLQKGSTNVILSRTDCSKLSLPSFGGKPFEDFDPDLLCGPKTLLYTCVALGSLFLMFVFGFIYYNKWKINHKCFLLKLFITGYTEVIDDEDYRYDINLVFHDDDEEWVTEKLVPNVRERDPTAVLCIGDDNLPLGMLRLDAVVEVIDNSYKSVFVISNASIESDWFITKLRLALQHMNHARRDAVLLVFLDDIPDGRLPYLIRLLLSVNRPYLQWRDDPRSQPFFWEKFIKAVRTTTIRDWTLPI